MISIRNVSKVYRARHGPNVVLRDVNLQVAKGQKIGIIGGNGAGKSTLIRLVGGAEYPSTGRIDRQMSVSWPLAFGGSFHNNLTGLDNLRFICRVYGADYAALLPFIEDFTELGLHLREPVFHYSQGMTARLAFALSLAIEFDCFLVDEVIAVGDIRFHEKCKVELFEKRKDRAMILVSHNPELIREHCASACVLHSGSLRHFDTVEEAYAHYQVLMS